MGYGVEGRFKREGTYVYLLLIHVVAGQKPTQHCKAIILQLKKNNEERHKSRSGDLDKFELLFPIDSLRLPR